MAFPDRIERTLHLAHPGLGGMSTVEGLGTWFGNRAEVDLRVGGQVKLAWDSGDEATLTIERLEPPRVFAYSWRIYGLPEDDPRRSHVEFSLQPDSSGTTLTMIETGFAQLLESDHTVAFKGNTTGWTNELGELVAYLSGQA